MHTPDYAITLRDSGCRVVTLPITGASIDDMIRDGYSRADAVENVESNAFQNAVAEGQIGEDAYITA